MQLKMGSATVSVAVIGVPPMTSAADVLHRAVAFCAASTGRRDAGQRDRDGRGPHFLLHRYGLGQQMAATVPEKHESVETNPNLKCANNVMLTTYDDFCNFYERENEPTKAILN
jgi:hypothetical protein